MKALVTGGGGFLGSAIVKRLIERGDKVKSLSRRKYRQLEEMGVECVEADIGDEAAVRAAVAGCDVVFHVAAKVGIWGRYADYYQANVSGTKYLLSACQDAGVGSMVFTGSPSVVFDGSDCDGWDESAPYAQHFDSYYSRTKALAEEMVLTANGSKFATVSLRPHLIWGPGDPNVVARILDKARSGRLWRIGNFNKRVDITYIDDAARAHLLAADRLQLSPSVGGRAYFLSHGDPRPIWDIVNSILHAAGLPSVERSIAPAVAKAGAAVCEAVWNALPFVGDPPLTKFLVSQLSTAHWFDISAARKDLGYVPSVSIEEGLRHLKESLGR